MNASALMFERRIGAGAWLTPLRDWPAAAAESLRGESAVVRVVIAAVRGSSPREVGTCMLVEPRRSLGTIGGGQLEWVAIDVARSMLADTACQAVRVKKFILGPQLAQCCGGVVELWLERYARKDLPLLESAARATARGPAWLTTTVNSGHIERMITYHRVESGERMRAHFFHQSDDAMELQERLDNDELPVWLYGAGHVGQALVQVLGALPVRLTWIDSRAELLPHDVPDSVRILHAADPVSTVTAAPRDTRFLVMTHSHPLDYALCKAVLERSDTPWVGVIGSKSKRARFRSRLLADGLTREQVDRLICPIGIDGIDSKLPASIAVSVAAQLLQTFEARERPARSEHESHDCSVHANGGCTACSQHYGASP